MSRPIRMPKTLEKQLKNSLKRNKPKLPPVERFRGPKGRHVLLTKEDIVSNGNKDHG